MAAPYMKTLLAALAALLIFSCAKKNEGLGYDEENPERTPYEVHCVTEPPPPPPAGSTAAPEAPLPDSLPSVKVPIEVRACSAIGDVPHFYNREMPGLVAVVDCNARAVRFKTRDWQIAEAAGISPTGEVNLKVMYISRLVSDGQGGENCWVRLLGIVSGHASCPGDPRQARFDFKVDWSFDETPPEIMEPASPGHGDLRNGKHCRFKPGNCLFTNKASVGCGG